VRHLVAIIAGAAKLSWGQFAAFAYAGALVWVTVFILIGYFLGPEAPRLADALRPYLLILALISVGTVVVLLLARSRRHRPSVDGDSKT
jgi:undecaprenyl-diphosphatase